jgi:SAM-dependent methyltransferase
MRQCSRLGCTVHAHRLTVNALRLRRLFAPAYHRRAAGLAIYSHPALPTHSGFAAYAHRLPPYMVSPVNLHPLATSFVDVADAYERGRPEYTPAAAQAIATELGLAPGARVLDLAAGTGKLTRALLGVGFDVVAVEPQAQLRELLAASVGAERVFDGLAEEIPLPDASVAAVTVADAIHWFDQVAALREIGRVLVAGGGLAVLRITPNWSGASWAHEVGTLIAELRPEHPQFVGPRWQETVNAEGGWTAPREVQLTMLQPASAEGVLAYITSMSWIAALPGDQRTETTAKIGELIAAGEMPDELSVHVTVGLTSLA